MRKHVKLVKSDSARRQSPFRRGLTTLEFVGCVIAVVGGMWLGAIYLGVDLRRVAHEALSDAEVLDKVPENWRPVAPEEEHMTRAQLVATLRQELSGLRGEIISLRTSENSAGQDETATETSASTSGGTPATPRESKEKTLAYWNRLNEIASGQAALQNDAASAFNESNAAKVFAIKSRISRFAAKAVEAVPHDGVDRTATHFGRQLVVWYDRNGELYDKAVRIWETTSAGSQGRAQLNEEWSRAELQRRNETRLLDEKASAVRSELSRRFGQEFPEFAQPRTDSAANAETPVDAK